MGGFSSRVRLFFICTNRTFHADLFLLLAPRDKYFWSSVLFLPSSQGVKQLFFFLCVGWGGLFSTWIPGRITQMDWCNLLPDVPHAEVEP